jgi:hypothetical protein
MATGRNNKLVAQIGEHAVCAELGRQGFIATPFAGNVPQFDVIAADESCHSVPIQVKATNSDSWRTDARHWIDIRFDETTGVQHYLAPSLWPPRTCCMFVSRCASDLSTTASSC